ncbi:MAG: protease [Ferrovibrionaceae bacterium]
MIQVMTLLLGPQALRRRWWIVGAFGALWFAIGLFFFANAMFDEFRIGARWFAVPLLIDGAMSLVAVIPTRGTARRIRLIKAGVFLLLGVLVLTTRHAGLLIGFIIGIALMADAIWRGASAHVVRFQGWRVSLGYAVFEFVMGLWSLVPWPTYYEGEIGADIGMLLMMSAVNICLIAGTLRRLPATAGPAHPHGDHAATATVHVWTPTGSLPSPVQNMVSRYVAAVDASGNVSTGHAALEMAPDVYVSHYPAVEIDRSGADFARVLRATADNNVAGRFLPSYAEESAGWCPSTFQIPIRGVDGTALCAFWALYRQDETYNLTNRNCSSAVALSLDAGIEGMFQPLADNPLFLIRLALLPETWLAGFIRQRAKAMAWTPGLVLDYARALTAIIALGQRWLARR